MKNNIVKFLGLCIVCTVSFIDNYAAEAERQPPVRRKIRGFNLQVCIEREKVEGDEEQYSEQEDLNQYDMLRMRNLGRGVGSLHSKLVLIVRKQKSLSEFRNGVEVLEDRLESFCRNGMDAQETLDFLVDLDRYLQDDERIGEQSFEINTLGSDGGIQCMRDVLAGIDVLRAQVGLSLQRKMNTSRFRSSFDQLCEEAQTLKTNFYDLIVANKFLEDDCEEIHSPYKKGENKYDFMILHFLHKIAKTGGFNEDRIPSPVNSRTFEAAVQDHSDKNVILPVALQQRNNHDVSPSRDGAE